MTNFSDPYLLKMLKYLQVKWYNGTLPLGCALKLKTDREQEEDRRNKNDKMSVIAEAK